MALPTTQAWQKGPHKSLLASAFVIAGDYFRTYPVRISLAVAMFLFSGLLDGVGLLSLVPMLDILLNETAEPNHITQMYIRAFEYVNLSLTLYTVIAVMVLTVSVKCLLMFFANTFVGYMVAGVTGDLRISMIHGLMQARWPFFTREPIGKLTNFIMNETNQASKAALALITIMSFSIQTLVYLLTAILVSWQLTVAGIGAGVVIAFVLSSFIRISRQNGARLTALRHSYTIRIIEWLHGIKPLKAMALEERVRPFLEKETMSLVHVNRRLVFATHGLAQSQEPITAIFVGVGVILAIQFFEVSTVLLLVMVVLFARTVGRINGVQKAMRKLAGTEAAYYAVKESLITIHDEAEARGGSNGKPPTALPELKTAIRFVNVDFAHDERKVLDDLSLLIEAGKLTAIVGPSGAGKSTVIDLLAGLLEPDRGQILVDDTDLQAFGKRDWRRTLGYVPQDTTLLHASIADNLTLGDESIEAAELERALRAAGAWDFVSAMPKGIHSMAGERGLKMSGGQRQRLAIARALVHRPTLLLLDEATSALDADAERDFCATLSHLVPQVTIVAISHRPAIEQVADVVYRMADGRAMMAGRARHSEDRAGDVVSSA